MSTTAESLVVKRLEGKVALITGGASGIGESTVRLFVKHGAKVLIADVQDELSQSLCKELGTPDIISYVHCDCDMQNRCDAELRAIDSDGDNFKKVLGVDVLGPFLGAKHAARVMIPARKGCILFTASVVSVTYIGTPHAYNTSKHAVAGLAKSLSVELGEHGIRVNCISPHTIPTPLLLNLLDVSDNRKVEEIISGNGVLKGAKLEAEDIAKAALFLASDEAKYVSGVNFPVDGAYSLSNQTWKTGLQQDYC
ncbi:SALT RESISTANT 1, ABA DEFICIENT 2, GLUCOSE INSENSITIVE 1, ARABIDOPSIS THALIANA ABA DEFICIENT 2 [Hibiscus trionum]|uniref:SALT RESISTANT 1, ABA DEFICIENT 2, GLUCOSE INSENSITIVE 1, ARABIDOPSIS THALIANA ABA DEFICIENT 2 n=1 Tax=Hibiscus trionum TaxID=183268 RepID=A0A9W7JIG9_HIBTR|nr:SALT RESISTANT 1, ABA DEFICIENT 2, GLUCOSE INSENSITIVE 1, ARABIDOPSIS THALIANA ABA DEFICIENT 2 [Hibiscus trionum]